jgi:hypothetical protein
MRSACSGGVSSRQTPQLGDGRGCQPHATPAARRPVAGQARMSATNLRGHDRTVGAITPMARRYHTTKSEVHLERGQTLGFTPGKGYYRIDPPTAKSKAHQASPAAQMHSSQPGVVDRNLHHSRGSEPKQGPRGVRHAPTAAEQARTAAAATHNVHELGRLAHHGAEVRGAADIRIARHSWEQLVKPILNRYGVDSTEAVKAKLAWQRINARRMPLPLALKAVARPAASEADMATVATKLLRGSGKVLAPVGFATGAWEAVQPSHHGWRGVGDRIAGGLSAAQPLTAAIALELIAVPGVGEVVLVVGAGVALWNLGNLAYDERKVIEGAFKSSGTSIVRTVEGTGKVIEEHPALLLGPEEELAKLAWDRRSTTGAVATKTIHVGDYVTGEMLHAAKWGVHETITELSKAAKAVEHAAGWLQGAWR